LAGITPASLLSPEIVVQVEGINLDNAVKYRGWLSPEGQETTAVPGSEVTVPVGEALRFPTESLPSGSYQVVVQALNANNEPLAQVRSEKIAYTQPSSRDRFVLWVQTTPWVLPVASLVAGMTLIGLLIIAWLIVRMASGGGRGRTKEVVLELPEVRRRQAPMNLDAQPGRVPAPGPVVDRAALDRAAQLRAAQERAQAQARSAQPAPAGRPDAGLAAGAAANAVALPRACFAPHSPANLPVPGAITRSPFSIGRRAGNDWVLQVDNTVGVSGQHATITFQNGRYYLTDNQSSYGTLLNGQRLPPNAPAPLADGALIGLGPKVIVRFRLTNCP
jgi:hypothetical protein